MSNIVVEKTKVFKVTLDQQEAKAVVAALYFVFNLLAPTKDSDEAQKGNTLEPVLEKIIDAFNEVDELITDDVYFKLYDHVDTKDLSYAAVQVNL